MKIILVKCSRFLKSHFSENSESLALSYLTAALRNKNFEVDVLDASILGLSLSDVISKITEKDYGLIGFTIADPTFVEPTAETIKVLRKESVKSHITMGGQSPTFHYREVFEMCPGLDSISMYEGEETIVELARVMDGNQDWRSIRNLAYRANGEIKCNPPRPLIADLDSLSFPARDIIPYILEHKKEDGVVSMAGGRGCPMNCGFCSIRAFYNASGGPLWRIRSNENIIDEMQSLVHKFGIDELLMVDDVFVGPGEKNKERILDLANQIESRRLSVMLSVAERVDNIDEEVFRRLREVGVRNILLGIESGDQKMLDRFDKRITIEQIIEAIETLQQLDIDITVSFINFTPWTTLEQLKDNIRFFASLKVNVLQGFLNRFQVYGGTPLGNQMIETGHVQGRFPNFSYQSLDKRIDLVYEIAKKSLGTFLGTTDELNKIQRRIRKKTFKSKLEGRKEETNILLEEKVRYVKLMTKVVEEAVDLLLDIIDFASSKDSENVTNVNKYSERMIEASLSMYKGWLGLMEFFKSYSFAYNKEQFIGKVRDNYRSKGFIYDKATK